MICDPQQERRDSSFSREYIHEKHPDWFHEKPFKNTTTAICLRLDWFDSTMLRIGAMNLQLHGIENPTLIGKDSWAKQRRKNSSHLY
jgi:type I restriction enzyme M protein